MSTDQIIELLADMPLVEALRWFIENMPDDHPGRSAVFFSLRERVRTRQ